MSTKLTLSVHDLVDSINRKGDIDDRIFNRTTMMAGSIIHRYYQEKQNALYLKEYFLEHKFNYQDFDITISGRADGVIIYNDTITIDEIKSCNCDIKEFHNNNEEWHLAQAKIYAYMVLEEKNFSSCKIMLTYISQNDNSQKIYNYEFSKKELKTFFFETIDNYLDFYSIVLRNTIKRNKSIFNLKFPFERYRKYQGELINDIINSIDRNENICLEASTGIGKSVSVLFPYIKNIGDKFEKVFFLTAKNSGQYAAIDTIKLFNSKGLETRCTAITSKENICPLKEKICNPEKCEFARDYYSKINEIVKSILMSDDYLYDYDYIKKVAKKYKICPFELQLDLALYSDIIVCDYNYVFDPFVSLDRFIEKSLANFALVIDEGHNLLSRARNMYSAEISLNKIKEALKNIDNFECQNLKKYLRKIDKFLTEKKKDIESDCAISPYFDNKLILAISKFLTEYTNYEKSKKNEILQLKDLFLDLNRFSKIFGYIDEKYICYYEKTYKDLYAKIFCVSPTEYIDNIIKRFKNVCLFSGTLKPFDYYKDVIFNKSENVVSYVLPSPFPKENFGLFIDSSISLKLKDRKKTIQDVVNKINTFINSKVGNYLIFVPSFEYLNDLKENLSFSKYNVIFQKSKMSLKEREEFLNAFNDENQPVIGIVVLGGVFSESVDLIGNKLIGVVVLSVGFPQMSFQNQQIFEYYERISEGLGFKYAYIYPGMNNVTQAVGRLIRSENDVGCALLIDSRFLQNQYKSLFKEDWKCFKRTNTISELSNQLSFFYNNRK